MQLPLQVASAQDARLLFIIRRAHLIGWCTCGQSRTLELSALPARGRALGRITHQALIEGRVSWKTLLWLEWHWCLLGHELTCSYEVVIRRVRRIKLRYRDTGFVGHWLPFRLRAGLGMCDCEMLSPWWTGRAAAEGASPFPTRALPPSCDAATHRSDGSSPAATRPGRAFRWGAKERLTFIVAMWAYSL